MLENTTQIPTSPTFSNVYVTGNVGIGTTTPNAKLELKSATSIYEIISSGTLDEGGLLLRDVDTSKWGLLKQAGNNFIIYNYGTGSNALSLNTTTNLATFAGNVSAPQLVSTIATGTAPLAVTSTTAVTNLSIGGNAATVTTNANLTGPITSTGNATAIASQTGTGTKFVVDTSPTITTPIISGTLTAQGLIDASGASAGQIKFPATQNASSNANTLDDYEEGTWTPIDNSGASLTFTGVSGSYEKIGRLVIARCQLTYPSTANGAGAYVGGLPFTVGNVFDNRQGFITYTDASANQMLVDKNTTSTDIVLNGTAITNAACSTHTFLFTVIYYV